MSHKNFAGYMYVLAKTFKCNFKDGGIYYTERSLEIYLERSFEDTINGTVITQPLIKHKEGIKYDKPKDGNNLDILRQVYAD